MTAVDFSELSPPYSTIVADPPWRYESAATKADAGQQYSTMSHDDIAAMPVESLAANDAHLWFWCTNALMEHGYRIVRAWGFTPLTVVTWCKTGPGVGHYLRNNTKPDAFMDLVEQVSPGPYVELFCRRPRFGWDSWGKGYEGAA